MRNLTFRTALSVGIISFTLSANGMAAQVVDTNLKVDCTEFNTTLQNAVTNLQTDIYTTVTELVSSCPDIADQVVEAAVSLTGAAEHQKIMQSAANADQISPADILLAAIAGGGDPTVLSEPTAGGNLAITPVSAATAPPIIGGRNGGAPEPDAASGS